MSQKNILRKILIIIFKCLRSGAKCEIFHPVGILNFCCFAIILLLDFLDFEFFTLLYLWIVQFIDNIVKKCVKICVTLTLLIYRSLGTFQANTLHIVTFNLRLL